MKKNITLLDLFSGIGGFPLGLLSAGFTLSTQYYSDIDPHANAIYKYQFPKAVALGDIKNIYAKNIKQPDIITFGSPCQDFSYAGTKKGLKGQRSSLIREAIKLIEKFRPSVFIWENVKGTYSSNEGRDFQAIMQAFTNIGGYRLEWQLLNSKWILPQNRERLYLIGHLDPKSRPRVFPFQEGDPVFKQTGNKISQKRKRIWGKALVSTISAGYDQLRNSGETYIHLNSGLKRGFETAYVGDFVDLSFPNSISRKSRVTGHYTKTIDTSGNGGVFTGDSVRRLTEVECELLQGFKKNWTLKGNYDGILKDVPRWARYHGIGNAVSANVVQMIGERLIKQ